MFFFSSRRRHTRLVSDWSSDVCSSDLTRMWRSRAWSPGVDVIFGYPGGAIMPFYHALGDHARLRHILVRHEQAAARSEERRVGKECRSRWSPDKCRSTG